MVLQKKWEIILTKPTINRLKAVNMAQFRVRVLDNSWTPFIAQSV
jgi:hypothetical protein